MLKLVSSTAKAAPKKAAPTKKAAPRKAAPSKAAARPRYDDDDEPYERQRRTSPEYGERGGAARGSAKSGWKEADEVFQGGDFANNLTLKDGQEVVIKFLEDAPYASMRIHWLERKGKRSYPCPGDRKKDVAHNGCPFCAYNISFRSEARFNVAVLTEEEPKVMSLTATPRNKKKIQGHHESKHGPLSRKFYVYRRTGTKFDTDYSFEMIRTPDHIAEDFPELYVPTEEELKALVLYTNDHANKEFAPIAEMRKVALEIVSGEDEDDEE